MQLEKEVKSREKNLKSGKSKKVKKIKVRSQ